MKYVRNGVVRWTPVVKRRKSTKSEDCDNSGNSNELNLIEG